jgi:dolichyl-phosphate-mannose-protein mannosyltransferase
MRDEEDGTSQRATPNGMLPGQIETLAALDETLPIPRIELPPKAVLEETLLLPRTESPPQATTPATESPPQATTPATGPEFLRRHRSVRWLLLPARIVQAILSGRLLGSNPRFLRRLRSLPWPLLSILIVQAILSVRLIWSNTAFLDEATYLYAGHQEIHTLVTHGTLTVPGHYGYYQSYFSGAPVSYPVLGALADQLGGLVAARLLSLIFMLGATTLLYLTATRIYDRRAAALGAMLFAIVAPTQFLGALATYDAMAVFLMALAGYLAVRSAQSSDDSICLPLASVAMVLADATKYATILFNPIIIGLAVVVSPPNRGWRYAFRQGYRMLAYSVTLAAALLAAGGGTYVHGLMASTFRHTPGSTSSSIILNASWKWVGIIAFAAVAAVVLVAMSNSISERRGKLLTTSLLASAVLLAPLEQAHIHTADSLQKHVDFGAWFAAMAAGYLLSKLVPGAKKALGAVTAISLKALSATTVILLAAIVAVLTVRVTIPQATGLYRWPNSSQEVALLRPWAQHANILAENSYIWSYSLGPAIPFQSWSNTWSLSYVDPSSGRTLTGPPAFQAAIAHHYFGTVALVYGTTGKLDEQLVADMKNAGGYIRVVHVRYGAQWFDVFHDVKER